MAFVKSPKPELCGDKWPVRKQCINGLKYQSTDDSSKNYIM